MNDLQEKIKERAYALYLQRGCKPGHAMEDWIKAELEIAAHQKSDPIEVTMVKGSSVKTMTMPPRKPQTETLKKERTILKKSNKPYEATLFSSNKSKSRSAL
jgi:hypothetical protein